MLRPPCTHALGARRMRREQVIDTLITIGHISAEAGEAAKERYEKLHAAVVGAMRRERELLDTSTKLKAEAEVGVHGGMLHAACEAPHKKQRLVCTGCVQDITRQKQRSLCMGCMLQTACATSQAAKGAVHHPCSLRAAARAAKVRPTGGHPQGNRLSCSNFPRARDARNAAIWFLSQSVESVGGGA